MTDKGDLSRFPTTWQTMCRVEYLKCYLDLLQHWRTRTFDTILYKISLVNLPMTLAFCRYKLFLSNSKFRAMRKSIRDCAWRKKDHVCGLRKNNISIKIYGKCRLTYHISFWIILQVVESRSTYYISFERMCLTDEVCATSKGSD